MVVKYLENLVPPPDRNPEEDPVPAILVPVIEKEERKTENIEINHSAEILDKAKRSENVENPETELMEQSEEEKNENEKDADNPKEAEDCEEKRSKTLDDRLASAKDGLSGLVKQISTDSGKNSQDVFELENALEDKSNPELIHKMAKFE